MEPDALVLAAVLLGLLVSGLSLNQLRYAMPQILQEPATPSAPAANPATWTRSRCEP